MTETPEPIASAPPPVPDKGQGLTPLAKRFAEVHARQTVAYKALIEARADLGLPPYCSRGYAKKEASVLLKDPAVHAYWEQCVADFMKYVTPDGKQPEWLKYHHYRGYYDGMQPIFTSPGELLGKCYEFLRAHENEAIGLNTLCAGLGIGLQTWRKYGNPQKKGAEFAAAVDLVEAICRATVEKAGWQNPKMAQLVNTMLNRMGDVEKKYEEDRAVAQVKALDKSVEVADQLTQMIQEIHGNGGRRYIPSSLAGLAQRQLVESTLAAGESLLDHQRERPASQVQPAPGDPEIDG